MTTRPSLSREMDSGTFRSYYYLKTELADFCRAHNLVATGRKEVLTERIAHYLDTGRVLYTRPKRKPRRSSRSYQEITAETLIEPDIICSENHRRYFKRVIGESFKFTVAFQKWLRSHAGATYAEAAAAYRHLTTQKRRTVTEIDPPFEYNTYIRDFFTHNRGMRLKDAIVCWRYKKNLRGHNRYEAADLKALKGRSDLSSPGGPSEGGLSCR